MNQYDPIYFFNSRGQLAVIHKPSRRAYAHIERIEEFSEELCALERHANQKAGPGAMRQGLHRQPKRFRELEL